MKSVLLDTQIVLWAGTDDPALPAGFRRALQSEPNHYLLHQASIWETQIKFDLGKLSLPEPPEVFMREAVTELGLEKRQIEDEALYLLGKLPHIHRDPFDRLLIAHAMLHGWEVMTVDDVVQQYPVKLFRPGEPTRRSP
jgi:PIN domain nuclease of toxin-antitoxin system